MTAAALYFVGALDDLFIDVMYAVNRLGPRKLSNKRWSLWRQADEKPIAILIPAWKESAVLESMLRTNEARIRYTNFRWFIGVYPNDPETLTVAKRLEKEYSGRVTVVVTDRPGPTSKGHCLNHLILALENQDWIPKFVAVHDAEDVIHPDSLTAINGQPAYLDFIQIPIFSMPVPIKKWIAGTYLDEFAELHLKELPVRQALSMPIPSAGVGTFFSWRIIKNLGDRFGYCFDETNLTEDYEVALRVARSGGRQRFLLLRSQQGDIIATREYFPDTFGASVRQKTRWTTGISLQTAAKWGFFGLLGRVPNRSGLAVLYGLYRDRKPLWSNPLNIFAWVLVTLMVGAPGLKSYVWSESMRHTHILQQMFIVNLACFFFRIAQRMHFTSQLYGPRHGLASIPRVFVSNFVNGIATLKAEASFSVAYRNGQWRAIKWDKTEHKYPTAGEIDQTIQG